MYKYWLKIILIVTLFTACDNTVAVTEKNNLVDTVGTTDMSQQERAKLIEGAKHNKEMIIGSWQLIAADSDKITIPQKQLDRMIIARIDFLNDSKFEFHPLHTKVDSGNYEWMAENREIVFTTGTETRRMLVKKIDAKSMVTKTGDLRFMFKRR